MDPATPIDLSHPPIAVIRDLLLAAFTPENLLAFCHDRDDLRPASNDFGHPLTLSDMVEKLITYCEKHELWAGLLAGVEAANPSQYRRHEPRLRGPTLAGGAHPTPPGLRPPEPPVPFVNQEQARRDLAAALTAGPGEIHTLVGLGGVGKTALAARVVADLAADFPGGVLWLSLETAPQPDAVWGQLAGAYGLPPSADPAAAAHAVLDEHHPLLVVDNAETAPETAQAILAGMGAATALVTTRDRLITAGLGRQPVDVRPLPRAEAATLFRVHAGGEHPPALVAELCELLGDLPLAINLAAGYVAGFAEPLDDYLALLRDSPLGETLHLADRRTRSVPASLDLTYRRLDDDAHRGLAVLALDGGESTALAAVAAGADWPDPGRARRACNTLVRHSLVNRDGERYRLHRLVRRYAAEQVDAAGRSTTTGRLVAHYLAFAEAHAGATREDYDALEPERLNLIAAVETAYREESWDIVQRLVGALGTGVGGYLLTRGYWQETQRVLDRAIQAATAGQNDYNLAAFLEHRANLLKNLGDYEASTREYHQTLAMWQVQGNRSNEAITLHQLGLLAQNRGDHAEARRLYDQSMEIKKSRGDQPGIAATLNQLGSLATETGDFAEARRVFAQSLEINETLGNRAVIALTRWGLGNIAYYEKDREEARAQYGQALVVFKELGDRANEAGVLGQLANIASADGDAVEAERLYREALGLADKIGDVVTTSIQLFNLALLCENQGRLDEALHLYERSSAIQDRIRSPSAEKDRQSLERVRAKLAASPADNR